MAELRTRPSTCLVVVLVLFSSLCASCVTSNSGVRVFVDHEAALVDTPLDISLHGVKPLASVTLRLAAVDVQGVEWQATAVFRADSFGVVNVGKSAPVSGAYSGVEPMGLFWSMKPVRAPPGDTDFVYPQAGYDATLQVIRGTTVVTSLLVHRAASEAWVQAVDERPASVGFYGEYFRPAATAGKSPAVIVLGGAEGGLATIGLAQLLASHGLAVLDLAYFGEPGLPDEVSDIPLEYFSHAVEWLSRQPEVDASRVDILGISRGAEAALLVASYLPTGVRGVVAAAPTATVFPPQPDPRGSAWTFDGKPLPGLSSSRGGGSAAASQKARIPVERAPASLLLICGQQDAIWPSCDSARSIEQSRGSAASRDLVLSEPGAGHGVASLVPYISEATTGSQQPAESEPMGGTPAGDGRGRANVWPQVVSFLTR